MIYSLDAARFNCATLFNLMCLYGNPIRIKFLAKKPGTAMVQFTDAAMAANTIQYLNEAEAFGQVLQIGKSRSNFIQAPRGASDEKLPDGSPLYHDFTNNKNFRHAMKLVAQPAGRRRPVARSLCLHYFNAPKNSDQQMMVDIFTAAGVTAPLRLERFDDDDSKRTDRGLIEFATIAQAVEALVVCNHHQVKPADGGIHTLKLAFSSRTIGDKAGSTVTSPSVAPAEAQSDLASPVAALEPAANETTTPLAAQALWSENAEE